MSITFKANDPATRGDIAALSQGLDTAVLALLATLLQQREPNLSYRDCVIRAISRVQAVSDPSVHVE
jgi:hypothetical protein